MSDADKILGRLPSRSLPTLLHDLQSTGSREGIPLVTIHLASGRTLQGRVLRLDEARGAQEPSLLLQLCDNAGRLLDDVAYLEPARIEAVTVHAASKFAATLSGGAVETPPDTPVPTKLGLGRRGGELARDLSDAAGTPIAVEIAWGTITGGPDGMRSLASLLEDATAALKDIVTEYGTGALRGKVATVRLEGTSAPTVALREDVLAVSADLTSGRKGRLDRDGIRQAALKVL